MISSVELNRHCAYEDIRITGLSSLGGILSLGFMSHLDRKDHREIPQVANDIQHFSLSWM